MVCRICGIKNPDAASFCMSCGSQLKEKAAPADPRLSHLQQSAPRGLQRKMQAARDELSGERKPVTILFTDIVGSTAIAETMDPEDWREVVAGVHQLVSEAIYRYEGTITQLLGDGVYAFFGAPITHEDDPERAILAALQIQENIEYYRGTLHGAASKLQMRVGINTGEVVIGDIGTDMHVEYLAFGDAVNVAARLESAAEPGSILISAQTHKLIGDQFPCNELSGLKVKGKKDALTAYVITGPAEKMGRARGLEGLGTVFVGREAPFERIQVCLDALASGKGSVVTIEAEAGIGKSRLLAELSRLVDPGSITWVEGRCLSYGGSIPYLPWIDLLSLLIGIRERDSKDTNGTTFNENLQNVLTDEWISSAPYLARLLSLQIEKDELSELDLMSGEELRAGTFSAVRAYFKAASGLKPMVIVLEDLHWVDATSLELLCQLIPLAESAPIAFLCAYRPGYKRLEGSDWLEALESASKWHVPISLEALPSGESQALVEGLLGSCDLPDDLLERIQARAEGNPFFVEEIIRSLIEYGDLRFDEDAHCWILTGEAAAVHIPDTLEGVLLARIDRLQHDTKRVLQMASVIGRMFLHRLLLALTEESRNLDIRLMELQSQQMIRERSVDPELEYIFKHHLLQEACYRTLLKKERKGYHKQLAEAIEALFPEWIEESPALLAYHWKQAGEWQQALDYYLQAGAKAQLDSSVSEAIELYEEALGLVVEQGELEQEAQIRMKLGLLYNTAHQFEQAQDTYLEAFDLWERVRVSEPKDELPTPPHPFRTDLARPSTIDPARLSDSWSSAVIDNLFSGLVDITRDRNIAPLGAKRWEILEQGRIYRFYLHEDVHWTDGQPVTSNDYLLGWQRFNESNPEFFPSKIVLEARGEYELEFRMDAPLGIFLYLIPFVYPNPKGRAEKGSVDWEDPEALVTNGHFSLRSWDEQVISLERNPDFHGRFQGNIQELDLYIRDIYDPEIGLEWYSANKLDLLSIYTMRKKEYERIQSCYPEEFNSMPMALTGYMHFDPGVEPMGDRRVRRAIVMALDREGLARKWLQHQYEPPTCGFIPPSMPANSPGISLPYDPDEARKQLAAAGYPGGEGFPELRWLALGAVNIFSEDLVEQLDSVLGISVDYRGTEPEEYFSRLDSEPWHVLGTGFGADYPDAYTFLGLASSHGIDQYDQIIQHAISQVDEQIRWEWYRKADRMLMDEAIVAPMGYGKNNYLVKPWISGHGGILDDPGFYSSLTIDPH